MAATAPLFRRLRVFVLDDDAAIIAAGVRELINDAPEKDLEYAGAASEFDDGLPQRLRQLGVDVVIADLCYGHSHDPKGLESICKLRVKLGPRIGILAYTSFLTEYGNRAREVGADDCRPKETPTDELRAAIRVIKRHETLLKIGIDVAEHRVELEAVLRSGATSAKDFYVSESALSLLCHLAEERMKGDSGWLSSARVYDPGKRYRFNSGSRAFVRWGSLWSQWEDSDISGCAHDLNRMAKRHAALDHTNLVVTPGPGNKRDESEYLLNPFIATDQIRINWHA
jgi:DNA-binding NarL/FixJ family response regulator